MVSHHTATLCCIGDIMVLVCLVILQDNVTKGSYYFVGGGLSWQVTNLRSSLTIDIVIVGI